MCLRRESFLRGDVVHSVNAVLVRTRTVAYAEAGRFDEAVKTAERAYELALAADQKELAATNQKLQLLYQARTPYRAD